MKTLDELINDGVVELGRGKVISKRDLLNFPGTYPVYSSAKNNDGKFGEYGKFAFDEELITWSVDGGGAIFHRRKHRFSITNVGGYIRIKKPDVICYRFLYFCLSFLHSKIQFDWVKKAHPSVIRRLYKEIPLPPLPEQKRIVAILEEAFAGIATAVANTEKNLANARELFESYLDSVFQAERPGWDRTSLGDLYEIGSSKRVHKKDWRENGVPFYRAREIIKLAENGAVNNELFISERLFQEYSQKTGVPQTDDLMVTAVGTLGICYVVQPADRFYFKDASVLWFRPKCAINANFIQYAFRSPLVERQTTDSQGATVGTLTISRAKTISISIPHLGLQEKIAKSLRKIESEVDRLRAVQHRKLVTLRELKESLLQKAFSGELTSDKQVSDAMRKAEEVA